MTSTKFLIFYPDVNTASFSGSFDSNDTIQKLEEQNENSVSKFEFAFCIRNRKDIRNDDDVFCEAFLAAALDSAPCEHGVVAPRNATEEIVRDAFAKILQLEASMVSVESNFFEIGGNSVLAISLVRLLQQDLDCDWLSVSDALRNPSASALSSVLVYWCAGQVASG